MSHNLKETGNFDMTVHKGDDFYKGLWFKQPPYCTDKKDTPGSTIVVCTLEVSKKHCLVARGE